MTNNTTTQSENNGAITVLARPSLESFRLAEISTDYSFGTGSPGGILRAFESVSATFAEAPPADAFASPAVESGSSTAMRQDGIADLAPGNTFHLSAGIDLCYGSIRDDTFIAGEVDLSKLTEGDELVGGLGIDTLLVKGGYGHVNLAAAAKFEGIERIVFELGTGQGNSLAVNVRTLRDVEYIDLGSGASDNLQFVDGVFNLAGKTILGAERLYLMNSIVQTTDKSLAMLLEADSRDEFHNGVVLTGQSFTAEERHFLFSKGISSISDDSGVYTNRAPVLESFGAQAVAAKRGESAFIDPTGSAILSDDSLLGSLAFKLVGPFEGRFGISAEYAGIGLPAGVVVGGAIRVGGIEIGTITHDGTTEDGLVIDFNGNATAERVQTLFHAITFTGADLPDFARDLMFTISLVDIYDVEIGGSYAIEVSDPVNDPVLNVTASHYTILDTETVRLFPDATVVEPNGESVSLLVKLDNPAHGHLEGALGGSYSRTGGYYRLEGTAAEIQTALQSLIFVPTDRSGAPGAVETTGFTITIRDAVGVVKNASVTVSARDGIGSNAPTDILLSEATVKEFAANTSGVGVLSAVDSDGGETFTYAFVTENGIVQDGGGRFGIAQVNGQWLVTVKDGVRIDFEQQRTFELKVRAVDLGGASVEKTITVDVRNVGVEIVNGTSGADTIKAGSGNDQLRGGGGNDRLHGGGGKDILTGGGGDDIFVFDTAANARTNIDTIIDFSVPDDKIYLDNAVFIRLGSGGTPANPLALTQAAFHAGADVQAGSTADHRIIYNTTTGALYYDLDGAGNGTTNHAAVQIAILSTKPALNAAQFFII